MRTLFGLIANELDDEGSLTTRVSSTTTTTGTSKFGTEQMVDAMRSRRDRSRRDAKYEPVSGCSVSSPSRDFFKRFTCVLGQGSKSLDVVSALSKASDRTLDVALSRPRVLDLTDDDRRKLQRCLSSSESSLVVPGDDHTRDDHDDGREGRRERVELENLVQTVYDVCLSLFPRVPGGGTKEQLTSFS